MCIIEKYNSGDSLALTLKIDSIPIEIKYLKIQLTEFATVAFLNVYQHHYMVYFSIIHCIYAVDIMHNYESKL